MAIRTIVKEGMIGDDILHKVCRPVEVFDEKLHTLLDDMRETLHAANGYGLAAPQVGIMRRVCVVDAEDGYLELVNPVFIEKKGKVQELTRWLTARRRWLWKPTTGMAKNSL